MIEVCTKGGFRYVQKLLGRPGRAVKKPGLANGGAVEELRVRWMLNLNPELSPGLVVQAGLYQLQGVCVSQHRQAARTTTNSHKFMAKTQTIN